VDTRNDSIEGRTSEKSSGVGHDWLTIKEVADELRASASHIKTLLGQRGGPVEIGHFKHGRRTYVRRTELERYKDTVESQTYVMRSPHWNGRRKA
jgi:hypothetical protein